MFTNAMHKPSQDIFLGLWKYLQDVSVYWENANTLNMSTMWNESCSGVCFDLVYPLQQNPPRIVVSQVTYLGGLEDTKNAL